MLSRIAVMFPNIHLGGALSGMAATFFSQSIRPAFGVRRFARKPRPHITAARISHFFTSRASHPGHASSRGGGPGGHVQAKQTRPPCQQQLDASGRAGPVQHWEAGWPAASTGSSSVTA